MADENLTPAYAFEGAAQAVLDVSENADSGIQDLVDAYSSREWDNPEQALQTVEDYANKIRQKQPGPENLLTGQEVLTLFPPKEGENVQAYEARQLADIESEESKDPLVRAYQDFLGASVEDTVTGAIQQSNNTGRPRDAIDEARSAALNAALPGVGTLTDFVDESYFDDAAGRIALGALPGLAKALGVEKYVQRNLRADSNDTFVSTLASAAGSVLSIPLAPVNFIINADAFGTEQYNKSLAAGADVPTALEAAGIAGANQAMDTILDALFANRALKAGTPIVGDILKSAGGEAVQEYAQNKFADIAEFVGLTKENTQNIGEFLTPNKQDIYSMGAGALVGGGARATTILGGQVSPSEPPPPPQTTEAVSTAVSTGLGEELGLNFPEILPARRVAVVGEPVTGAPNITTVETAEETPATNILGPSVTTDVGENIYVNEDGTTSRDVVGDLKQAHGEATIISEETAEKVGQLQGLNVDGVDPVVIQIDDLGRPYIQHPNVTPDLIYSETPTDGAPVMIPEDTSGHLLQTSERIDDFGSVENRATLSQGKASGVQNTGIGAGVNPESIGESTIADKLRNSRRLNPYVNKLLGLDREGLSNLTYFKAGRDVYSDQIDRIFSRYDNNLVDFANEMSGRELEDISETESIAMGIAAAKISDKANEIRETNPLAAQNYDGLSDLLVRGSVAKGTIQAQDFVARKLIPFNGNTIASTLRNEVEDEAVARVAVDNNVSVDQVQRVQDENLLLDKANEGLSVREDALNEQEVVAQERYDTPDKQVSEIEKEITTIDDTGPAVIEAQKAVDEAAQEEKVADTQAAVLEKEAEDIETEQEVANEKVQILTKDIEDLTKAPEIVSDTTKVDALITIKQELPSPELAPVVIAAKENIAKVKKPSEKAAARLEYARILNEEKLKAKKESARLDAEIAATKKQQADALKQEREQRKADIKAKKDELALEKEKLSKQRKTEAANKKKEANALRAAKKAERLRAQEQLKAAKAQRAIENADRKRVLKEQLTAAKEARKASAKERKAQLDAEKARIKAEKEKIQQDRETINERKIRNEAITEAVDKYKQEFANKLTSAQINKLNDLVNLVQTTTGTTRTKAVDQLGRTIADIKGIKLLPGQNAWQTLWQANVLSSISTNFANIVGNVSTPIRQTLADIALGKFSKAGRFIRGWASTFIDGRIGGDIYDAFTGQLESRPLDTSNTKEAVKDIKSGLLVTRETDAVRTVQSLFGTGKLGKFLSSPAYSLRMLGAMDAVFSRASQQGRIAREYPTYTEYLNAKAADYSKFVIQARNEEAQLKRLDIEPGRGFVNRRADELSFESKPQETQDTIRTQVRRDVFQAEDGARGATAGFTARFLRAISNTPISTKLSTDLNVEGGVKNRVAYAVGYANKVVRNNVSIDEIYPVVIRGLSDGKTLVINGKDITASSSRQILGEIVNALNAKQVISLKGDSIKPLKYVLGQFINTSSQILDLGIELIPGVGLLDQKLGGSFDELTTDQKAQLYGTQLASSAMTAVLAGLLIPNMDDEENARVYVYGGMRDEKLRRFYQAKGIQPFSIRFGDKTLSYKDIPGFNLILGGIGGLSDAYMVAKRTPENPLNVGSALQAMSVGSMYAASQLSLLKNVGVLTDLIAAENSESKAADVFSNVASGAIPFSGAGRELERFVYGDLARPKDLTNRMLQNIPFAKFVSENQPALNIFGEPLRQHVIPGLSRFVGDAKGSSEIDWLLRNGYTVTLPKPSSQLTKKQQAKYTEMLNSEDPENFEPYLTQEDQRKYMQILGPILKSTLNQFSNSYPQGFNPKVQSRLDSKIKKAKDQAKKQVLRGD